MTPRERTGRVILLAFIALILAQLLWVIGVAVVLWGVQDRLPIQVVNLALNGTLCLWLYFRGSHLARVVTTLFYGVTAVSGYLGMPHNDIPRALLAVGMTILYGSFALVLWQSPSVKAFLARQRGQPEDARQETRPPETSFTAIKPAVDQRMTPAVNRPAAPTPEQKAGRRILLAFLALLLLVPAGNIGLSVAARNPKHLPQQVFSFVLAVALFAWLYRGSAAARSITILLAGLGGLLTLTALGSENPVVTALAGGMSLLYLSFAAVLLKSAAVKAFLDYQRGRSGNK